MSKNVNNGVHKGPPVVGCTLSSEIFEFLPQVLNIVPYKMYRFYHVTLYCQTNFY